MEQTKETLEKIQAQEAYISDKNYRAFGPNDGICYFCSCQIYNRISLETASAELIIRCPHCDKSFVHKNIKGDGRKF